MWVVLVRVGRQEGREVNPNGYWQAVWVRGTIWRAMYEHVGRERHLRGRGRTIDPGQAEGAEVDL